MNEGFVYFFALDDELVKIGKTRNITKRIEHWKDRYSRTEFSSAKLIYWFKTRDYTRLETLIYRHFSSFKYNGRQELFRFPPAELKELKNKSSYPSEISDLIFEEGDKSKPYKNVTLGMNLKNLMSGVGYHIPAIFAMDTRLDGKDLILIGIMLSYISNNGECMPTDQHLADGIRYTTESVRRIREKLWDLEYLSWEPAPSDNRRNLYEFNIPYWSSAWQQALNWRDPLFDFTEESLEVYLTKILDGIVEPEEITQKIRVKILLSVNSNIINKYNNKDRSKLPKKLGLSNSSRPKSDKRKSKNGRKEEACLLDPANEEFYEDDPQATVLLINTYSTWLNRRSKGKGHGPAFLRSNSTYYKYFVKLRKRLLSFRGDRGYPEIQSLFWDFFTFLGREYDNRGWTEPYIRQMPSDGVWEIYVNYITQNFPSGSYWLGETFRVDEVSGGIDLVMES